MRWSETKTIDVHVRKASLTVVDVEELYLYTLWRSYCSASRFVKTQQIFSKRRNASLWWHYNVACDITTFLAMKHRFFVTIQRFYLLLSNALATSQRLSWHHTISRNSATFFAIFLRYLYSCYCQKIVRCHDTFHFQYQVFSQHGNVSYALSTFLQLLF